MTAIYTDNAGYHVTQDKAERWVALRGNRYQAVPYRDRHGQYAPEQNYGVWDTFESCWVYVK